MTDAIITQVSPETPAPATSGFDDSNSNIDFNSKIHLNIRGSEFTITRDELMSLPESILLCLFPNGVFLDVDGQVITNLTEEDIVYVNFEPSSFQYIIDVFSDAQRDLLEMPAVSPQVSGPTHGHGSRQQDNVLQNKPAIIVLREDLDYYVIPEVPGLNISQMRHLKLKVSEHLLNSKLIFSGLGYNPYSNNELGPAEKHLFDMLCSSGFDPAGKWGSRSLEPSKCVILSLLLVRLRSTPPTPPDSPKLDPVTSNASQSSRSRSRSRFATLANSATRAASRSLSKSKKTVDTNQTKLLLFWRKPARKCWWSNEALNIEIDVADLFPEGPQTMHVKIHLRRVWTLELSVIGVQ